MGNRPGSPNTGAAEGALPKPNACARLRFRCLITRERFQLTRPVAADLPYSQSRPSIRYAPPIKILLLCTANLCRSPIAEAVLRAQLAKGDRRAAVRSAGFLEAGQQSPPEVAAVLGQWGVAVPTHASRMVSRSDLAQADLVLCMERLHVREAVVLDPKIWPRTFTLKEIVRRGSAAPARAAGESLESWLARIHAGRDRSDLLGASSTDDVADPYGKKISAYEATLAELVDLTGRLIEQIWSTGEAALDDEVQP